MFEFPIERPEGLSDEQWYALAQQALRIIKANTPVRTGRLRKGWQLGDLSGDSFSLVNDVPYAGFVNDGTDRMAPRDMTGQTLASLM